MRVKRLILGSAVTFFLVSASAVFVHAQPPAEQERYVSSVKVQNNKSISAETITSKIRTRVGDKFNQDVLNEDLKRLYSTDFFTDVSVDVREEPGGMAVSFIVEEKPIIESITFEGNIAFRAAKLSSLMKSKQDEMLNPAMLAQDTADLKDFYVKKGYPLVDIRYELDLNRDTNKVRVLVIIDEKTKVKVSKIDIAGNKAIKTDAIKKVLATKPASFWFFQPGVFKDDVLQEDLERVKSLYEDIGYLDAEVTPKIDYSPDGKLLNIEIDINEGRQYLVGTVTVTGNIVLPEKDVEKKITLKSGKPFSMKALRDDVYGLRQYYYFYGYMNASIDVERTVNPDTGNIDVIYTIEAQEVVYIEKIDIRGNLRTKDVVIRRELRVYPGERFNGDKIKRSKERIYNLGFFENVSFDTETTEDPAVSNLIVTVKESKTGEFSFGGGYSSIDQLIGFVEVQQRNFDIMNWPTFMGGGQNLTLKAELGMVRSNYNVSWTDPWIFGFPYLFGFDFYRAAHSRSGDVGWAYDETRTGGDLRFGKEITETLRVDATYRLEEVKIENIDDNASAALLDEAGSNYISSLGGLLTYDTRDNIYTPSKGVIMSGSAENAGGFCMGDKNFFKWTLSAAWYHTFIEKFLLELKGRAGWVSPYGSSDTVPIYERFFAGGQNTIRGYRERRVGPRDPGNNDPVGGESILVGNAEVTFPLFEKVLKGAVFYDVGNVWEKAGDMLDGSKLKSGVGVGLRINTPIGPVRVDYGYPLVSNYDDSKDGEFYFSMSRGF